MLSIQFHPYLQKDVKNIRAMTDDMAEGGRRKVVATGQ